MAQQFYVCQVTTVTHDGQAKVAWLPEANPVTALSAQQAVEICVAEGDMAPGAAVAFPTSEVLTVSLETPSPGLQVNVDPPPPPILPA